MIRLPNYNLTVPIGVRQTLIVWSDGPVGLREMSRIERYLELQRAGMVEDELRDWLKVAPPSFFDVEALP